VVLCFRAHQTNDAVTMKHEHMMSWTPEEDLQILTLFAQEGRKWGKIAGVLKNRSSASVRNRYLRIENGRKLREEGKSKNRCAACGQLKLGHVCAVKRPFQPGPAAFEAFRAQPPLQPSPTPAASQALDALPPPTMPPPAVAEPVSRDDDLSAPPIASSVVATLEPTEGVAIEPAEDATIEWTYAATVVPIKPTPMLPAVADEAVSPSDAAPDLACSFGGCVADDIMRLPWMQHGLSLAPILKRLPSSAAA